MPSIATEAESTGKAISGLRLDAEAFRPDPARQSAAADASTLEIAIVNNMPDAALLRTEQQFMALLTESTESLTVRFALYSLPTVPRGERGLQHIAHGYRAIDELWSNPPDALIVTGTEPQAPNLRDEPYWNAVAELINWAEDQAIPTMFSCLAAHAAVLHLDGIQREPLGYKCFGVFDHEIAADHPLTEGAGSRMWLPHSRWNQVTSMALVAAGYQVLCECSEAGVGFFAKERSAPWLFCQGHPEYDGANLVREYRRDVQRFLLKQRAIYPDLPQNYFADPEARVLGVFKDYALNRADAVAMDAFPSALSAGPTWDAWRPAAIRILHNWLHCKSKTEMRSIPRTAAVFAD